MAENLVNLFDYQAMAGEKLALSSYDMIEGGATDEITMRRTRKVLDAILLRPRMLTDVSEVDISTTLLGHAVRAPIMLDPAGGHAMAHADGELATARAAGAEGVIMAVSAMASRPWEEIAAVAAGPLWAQGYLLRDRERTREQAERARAAGYSVFCITLDTAVPPKRERVLRHGRSVDPPEIDSYGYRGSTWKDIEWVASNIELPVVAKGIMTGEDAALCAEHGLRGLIVSNHGGRQLDTTFATIEVLPEVVEAAGALLDVYLDGGIRRGSDVVKALALGARAVLIGRPLFWGLAVDGEAGVRSVIRILTEELRMTMAMCGRPNVSSLDATLLGLARGAIGRDLSHG